MGISTVVEILSDVDLIKTQNEVGERVEEVTDTLEQINIVLINIKRSIAKGNQITSEQERYLKMAAVKKPKLEKQIADMEAQYSSLQTVIESAKKVSIKVENIVNPGVKIIIKDVARIINDDVSRCRFVLEGADIKILGY